MLRSPLVRTLLVAALMAVPAAARSQTCLGNPSFSTNHLQLSADASFPATATAFGASIGSGSETVFGRVGIGGVTYDNSDGSTLVIGGTVGYQVTSPTTRRFQICPVLSAAYGMGPKDFAGSGNDLRTTAFSFGLSAGGEFVRMDGFSIIPAASVGFAYWSSSVDAFGGAFSTSDTYGLAGVTLGIVLNSQLSVRPSVSLPFGVDERDPVYGIGVTLNYGGRR